MNALELETLLVEGLYAHRDAQTAQRTAEKGTGDRTNPYVTELGKPCDRAVWRNLHGHDGEDFDAATLLRFLVGHATEEAVAKLLGAKKVEFVREVRVELPAEGTIVSGRIDFLLLVDDVPVELKSIGPVQLEMMIRKKEQGRTEHVSQENGYLHASQLGALKYRCGSCDASYHIERGEEPHDYGFPCGRCDNLGWVTVAPAHKGFVVYVNSLPDWKATLSYNKPIHVIEVSYDMLRARREIQRLGELWAQETEPDIPAGYSPTRFPCGSQRKDGSVKSWCSHHERCWG